jgi:hypothetical protein
VAGFTPTTHSSSSRALSAAKGLHGFAFVRGGHCRSVSEYELNEPDEREGEDDYALDKGNLDRVEEEREEDLERERSPDTG